MRWKNTEDDYGAVAIAIHWTVAIAVLGIFSLGLWMTGLTYYDDWYRTGPEIHKGLGVLLFLLLVARLAWRSANPVPRPEPSLGPFERWASRLVHRLLYVLLLAVALSGYLISTADGRPLEVFGLFSIPATLTGLPNQADMAGTAHLALAIAVVSLASIHALAALKHHFVDRDSTLLRMLGRHTRRPF